ncbi:ABC transporter ATP-binding protein [Hoeflea sp. CAU 1731]
MSSYLNLSGVNKMFGDFQALDDVNLDIERGEFVTFLGPSGSGKTTTLMIIAGFEQATKGHITIDGKPLDGLKPYQRNIGIVFQNYALFPHKTAVDNVYFPLQMRGVGRRDGLEKANRMLELVGLKGFSERHSKELSGGQQQRVALARALVFEPSLLLLDEPLGALDKNLREQMQIEIKRIQKRLGVTTIFVTHDQTEAMSMSDRIVVFDKGRIEQVADPLDLYHRPNTRFVAGFVGESNIMAGHVVDAAAGVAECAVFGTCRYTADARFSNGQAVNILIRPEHLKISRKPPESGEWATMTVDTIVNYGDNALVIGHSGDHPVRVRVLGADVVIIREGEDCHISWRPDAVHIIAET